MNFGARRPRIESAIPGGLMERLSNELVGGKNKKLLLLRQLSCVELNTLGSLCLKKDRNAIKIMGAYYWTHAKDMESYFGDRFLRIKTLIGIKDKEVNIFLDQLRHQLKDYHALFCREEAPDEYGSLETKKIRRLQEGTGLDAAKRIASALTMRILQDEVRLAAEIRVAAGERMKDLQADFPTIEGFKDFVSSTLGIQWEIIKAKMEKSEAEKDALDRRPVAANQSGPDSEKINGEKFKETLDLIKAACSMEELDKIETDWVLEKDYYEFLNALTDRERILQKKSEDQKREMEQKQKLPKSASLELRKSLPVKQKKEKALQLEQPVKRNQPPFDYYSYLRGEIKP
jgi:hypothetical protein